MLQILAGNSSGSLYGRLSIILLLFGVLSASLLLFYVVTVVDKLEATMLSTLVGHEIDEIVTDLHQDPDLKLPRTPSVNVYLRSRDASDPVPDYLRGLSANVHSSVSDGNRRLHVAVVDVGSDTLYFEFDVTSILRQQTLLLSLLIGGGLLAIFIFSAIALWLSRKYLKPVGDLADELTRISPDDRNVRLSPKYKGYEVARIADSFDEFTVKMDEFVERQQSFAAAVSHELRTPVAEISTSLDLLEQKGVDRNQREVWARIKSSSTYMGKIIESLLLSIKKSHQYVDDTMPEISLAGVFESVVESYRQQARQKHINLKLVIKSHGKVRMSESHAEIILSNLLRNALANTEAGEVRVLLTDAGFSVVDSGRGIESDEINDIVQLSYRNRNTNGFGVGLYLVKSICNYYGLDLHIESQVGSGSEFSIAYPSELLSRTQTLVSASVDA